jgi:hypothetical protein
VKDIATIVLNKMMHTDKTLQMVFLMILLIYPPKMLFLWLGVFNVNIVEKTFIRTIAINILDHLISSMLKKTIFAVMGKGKRKMDKTTLITIIIGSICLFIYGIGLVLLPTIL